MKFISALLLILSLVSCSTKRAYPGPALGPAATAIIKGYHTECGGRLKIVNFDGEYSGTQLEVLPGVHILQVEYEGYPYISDSAGKSSFLECVNYSRHQVTLNVTAELTYLLRVVETSATMHTLKVLETDGKNSAQTRIIPTKIEQLENGPRCSGGFKYLECFR